MEENWRDVPGYEGLYQISIDTPEGRCRSLNLHVHKMPKLLCNKPDKRDGRIKWTLCKDHKTCRQAARWIAITYPELVQNEYFEGAQIDHIDTNKLNNHPSNLRWVTARGNMNNPLSKIQRSESLKGKRLNRPDQSKPVVQLNLDGTVIKDDWPSAKEVERVLKYYQQKISACCLGKLKTYKGFIWRYKEKEAV